MEKEESFLPGKVQEAAEVAIERINKVDIIFFITSHKQYIDIWIGKGLTHGFRYCRIVDV